MATRAASNKSQSNSSTSRRAAEAAHETVDKVAERAESAETKLRDAADDAKTRLERNARAARERGEALGDSVKTMVHEHPVATLGVAFLTGVLVASLLRR